MLHVDNRFIFKPGQQHDSLSLSLSVSILLICFQKKIGIYDREFVFNDSLPVGGVRPGFSSWLQLMYG